MHESAIQYAIMGRVMCTLWLLGSTPISPVSFDLVPDFHSQTAREGCVLPFHPTTFTYFRCGLVDKGRWTKGHSYMLGNGN